MTQGVKWLLWTVLIIAVLAFIIYLFISWPRQATTPGPAPGPAPSGTNQILEAIKGFFSSDWIKNLFGGNNMAAPACQPNNPGYDNNGYYTRTCGGVPGGGDGNCDPDNPGKDMNGFNSTLCGG